MIKEEDHTLQHVQPVLRVAKYVKNSRCASQNHLLLASIVICMCDAEYVGYTSRHLHQRADEHRYSAIGKHLKNDHGLETIGDITNNLSVLKKCNEKTESSDLLNIIHKEEKAMLEHTITLQGIRAQLFI